MLDEKLLQDVWEDLENQNKTFFETGFEDLDCVLGIQEKKGAVITIGARPAMGKTTFMLSIMENILQKNKKCIYFYDSRWKDEYLRNMEKSTGLSIYNAISAPAVYVISPRYPHRCRSICPRSHPARMLHRSSGRHTSRPATLSSSARSCILLCRGCYIRHPAPGTVSFLSWF